jgi:RNA polymerase sigma factor (sigma-70 family)
MNTPTSSLLITAACQGDPEAIEQLLIQYHPTITRFARKFCATPEDVEDAVQETLWIATQKIGTLRVSAAFVSWVFRVVQHECYRLLHHKQREQNLDCLLALDQANSDPERHMMLKQDVVNAIAQLPIDYRQVLIMRDVEELTAPEVAIQLGMTIETVKSRLHRARKILREALRHWSD